MKKICICGHFAKGIESYDGQTVKTQSIYANLIKKYGKDNVSIIDTYGWKKKPLNIFFKCLRQSKEAENMIILPAHKGVKIFVPLFNILKRIYKFKLHYIVIGGWIYSLIHKNLFMKNQLKKVDFIYLENNNTISQLKKIGLNNLYQMNNFKDLVQSNYKYKPDEKNFKCCIFSRIEEKKGITVAIDTINKINYDTKTKVTLDIYGKVSKEYEKKFKQMLSNSNNTNYKGTISPNMSVNVIEKYDLLLFPTLYFTEGIPGTIIDSYFSGVPVLASKWENFNEIIEDNVTGFGFKFADNDDFYNTLKNVISNRKFLSKMREKCLEASNFYTPNVALKILYRNVGE